MNLHRLKDRRPDWYGLKWEDMNRWQKVASATHGVVSPGNIVTVAGVGLVHYGQKDFKNGHRLRGALIVALGFSADFVDGMVADITKTKSPTGEKADAVADKYKLGSTLKILVDEDLMPHDVAELMVFQNVANAAATGIAKLRSKEIHTSLAGKVNIALQKASLGLYAGSAIAQEYQWPELADVFQDYGGNVAAGSTLSVGATATIGYFNDALAA